MTYFVLGFAGSVTGLGFLILLLRWRVLHGHVDRVGRIEKTMRAAVKELADANQRTRTYEAELIESLIEAGKLPPGYQPPGNPLAEAAMSDGERSEVSELDRLFNAPAYKPREDRP